MRKQSLNSRTVRLRAWGLVLIGLVTGCAVERSSVSIDSDSRVPFLGLQLAPSKSKEPAYHRPIARQKHSSAGDQAQVALAVETPKTEAKWSDWLNPLPQRVSQPLPRTEPATPSGTLDADAAVEF